MIESICDKDYLLNTNMLRALIGRFLILDSNIINGVRNCPLLINIKELIAIKTI